MSVTSTYLPLLLTYFHVFVYTFSVKLLFRFIYKEVNNFDLTPIYNLITFICYCTSDHVIWTKLRVIIYFLFKIKILLLKWLTIGAISKYLPLLLINFITLLYLFDISTVDSIKPLFCLSYNMVSHFKLTPIYNLFTWVCYCKNDQVICTGSRLKPYFSLLKIKLYLLLFIITTFFIQQANVYILYFVFIYYCLICIISILTLFVILIILFFNRKINLYLLYYIRQDG